MTRAEIIPVGVLFWINFLLFYNSCFRHDSAHPIRENTQVKNSKTRQEIKIYERKPRKKRGYLELFFMN